MSKAASDEIMTGKILAARRALRRTDWDGSDLDHFVQVLCSLDAVRHGFGALDLLAVEGAWIDAASATWSGGFVARLKDGRRAHVDGRAGSSQWSDEDCDIAAALLEGTDHRVLGTRHGRHGHGWDDAMASRLNELLDRVEP